MTTIFCASGSEGTELCFPATEEDDERVVARISRKHSHPWLGASVVIRKHDENHMALAYSDSPWPGVDTEFYFRESVVVAMGDWLRKFGDLLEIKCSEPIWLYDCTRVIDALDLEKSRFRRMESTGLINSISHHELKRELIQEEPVFRLAGWRVSPIYLGQEFVDRWNHHGFKGLDFDPIWQG